MKGFLQVFPPLGCRESLLRHAAGDTPQQCRVKGEAAPAAQFPGYFVSLIVTALTQARRVLWYGSNGIRARKAGAGIEEEGCQSGGKV